MVKPSYTNAGLAQLEIEGMWLQASLEALCCAIEQGTLSSAKYWFKQGRPVPT